MEEEALTIVVGVWGMISCCWLLVMLLIVPPLPPPPPPPPNGNICAWIMVDEYVVVDFEAVVPIVLGTRPMA